MIFTWLNDDELREIGWEEKHIDNGLVGQVAAFFFVKDENVTFRGEEWAALITTWI